MTTTAIKKKIHDALKIVENPEILKAVELILNRELKHNKEVIGSFSFEDFYSRNKQSQKDIELDRLVDHKIVKAKYKAK